MWSLGTKMDNQVNNRPSAAYYLTLVGGLLGIILGLLLLIVLIGVWIIIANIAVIICAQRLMTEPKEHSKYGILILVFSILSFNIITLIGGILALIYEPEPVKTQNYQPVTPQPQTIQYATTKYCPQCGNPIGGEAQYCPKCGTKLPP